MEIWFVSAVAGAVFSGFSNFYFKLAAARGYNSELFSLYGSISSGLIIVVAIIVFSGSLAGSHWLYLLAFVGGFISAFTGIFKVLALRYVDSTIYFPLFKLLAPLLAIVAGVTFFAETFGVAQWTGMILSLFVPLMLITKAENGRQNNLLMGLALVLFTGFSSALASVVFKYVIDDGFPVLTTLLVTSIGVSVGSILALTYKNGLTGVFTIIREQSSMELIKTGSMRSFLIMFGMGFMLYAYATGGTLAIVQTIHSLYILIPIVLAIIFYGEHWNVQKAAAIILSVAALALMG